MNQAAAWSPARGPCRLHSPGPGARALLPGGALLVSHGLAIDTRRESPPRPLCLSIRRIISRAEAAGEEGGRGRGRPHRRAPEQPPDPTQPPAVGETPAWAHVTRASQPVAAPETSNAASGALHPRRVRARAAWGYQCSLWHCRRRISAQFPLPPLGIPGWRVLPHAPEPLCPGGCRGRSVIPREAWSRVGGRSEVCPARHESTRLRSPGRTAFSASAALGYSDSSRTGKPT